MRYLPSSRITASEALDFLREKQANQWRRVWYKSVSLSPKKITQDGTCAKVCGAGGGWLAGGYREQRR